MKIYFAGAIRGGRQDVDLYEELVSHLKGYGQVLSEHVGSKDLDAHGSHGHVTDIHNRNVSSLQESDVVVAEVTTPSLGVGYELGKAAALGKPTLCLYRPAKDRKLSAMIGGCPDVTVKEYSGVEEAKGLIDEFMGQHPGKALSRELQVGVKTLLKNPDGEYLVLRRNKEKYPNMTGQWDIPGGRIEPGTTLMENLRREVWEETNLKLESEPRLIATQDILRMQGKHVVRLTYLSEASGEPSLDEEHNEYKWLPLEKLKSLRGLDRYLKELFDHNNL